MRHFRDGVFGLFVSLAAIPAMAQTPLGTPTVAENLVPPPSWAFNDLACAPSSTLEAPGIALRVVGSQDTVIKQMMGPGDILVISGGSAAGLQSGQRYFVRRIIRTGERGRNPKTPLSVQTSGWIQILGVDTTLATATIVHACEGILLDDYLEPFVEPRIAARPLAGNTPEYQNMGRILTGHEAMQAAGVGQLMTIDRGSTAGVLHGQRFLVFRDKRSLRLDPRGKSATLAEMVNRVPRVEIGEVLVVAVRPNDSTVQVLVSKDAIETDDLIAPIR
jgi:hypothetical protein